MIIDLWPMSIFSLIAALCVLAFWVAVIWLIVALARGSRRQAPPPAGTSSTALKVLEERFARGEIDRDEFVERRAVLTDRGRSDLHSPR